ncbi:MAG: hypothetical protein ACFFD8_07785 [Candidatus Thorarchaeota archaeon]
MDVNLTNRGRWIIASFLLTIGAFFFVIGWTSPFWPSYWGWLGLPWIKTTFPFAMSLVFLILLIFGIWVLSKTSTAPIEVGEKTKSP